MAIVARSARPAKTWGSGGDIRHGECLAAALRCLDAPGENLKLMPLARRSMPCFNGFVSEHLSLVDLD